MRKKQISPEIVNLSEPIQAAGFSVRTGMKTVFKDVGKTLNLYLKFRKKNPVPHKKIPWAFVALSRNFKDGNLEWEYLTGDVVECFDEMPAELITFEIPAGQYAVFEVRPKNLLFWGFTIGMMKKYIYNEWLPQSGYQFSGVEFEYNDEKMAEETKLFLRLYVGVTNKREPGIL